MFALIPSVAGKIPAKDMVALELMSKVDQFYNSAWGNLNSTLNVGLTIVTIVVAIFGIILPIYLQHLMRKNYEKEYEDLKNTTQEQIALDVKKLQDQITDIGGKMAGIASSVDKVKSDIDKAYHHAMGGVFFVQGDFLMKSENAPEALRSYFDSLAHSILLGDDEIIRIAWARIKDLISSPVTTMAVKGNSIYLQRVLESISVTIINLKKSGKDLLMLGEIIEYEKKLKDKN